MMIGPQPPSGGNPGQGGRRRRRRGRGGASNRGGQPGNQTQGQNQGQGQPRQNGQPRHNGGQNRGQRQRGAFSGPMDHSYRNPQQGNGNGGGGGRQRYGRRGMQAPPKFYQHADVEPLAPGESSSTRIYAFIEDLFFVAKIQEVSRKLNIKVDFVKTDKEFFEKLEQSTQADSADAEGHANGNGEARHSVLVIFDLNNLNAKPLQTIPKIKKQLKKDATVIGFVQHVQGDLKLKAQEAGCDMVVPRSAFSSNLPQLLRRHAEDLDEQVQ